MADEADVVLEMKHKKPIARERIKNTHSAFCCCLGCFVCACGLYGEPEPTPTPDNKLRSVEVGLDDFNLSGLIDDDYQMGGDFGDVDVSFKNPDNSAGIVVTPRETTFPERAQEKTCLKLRHVFS